MRISLKRNISPHFYPVMSFKGITHYILSGGRGSTKTSFVALMVCLRIINNFNGSAVVMRKYHNKIEQSVFREIQRAFKRLGVSKRYLKIRKKPYSITYLPTGNTVYFSGLDNIDDIKGFIDEDKPIETVWLEELTEFKGTEEIYNIRATFNRSAQQYKMFYTYNNPTDIFHWIYEFVEKEQMREDVVYNSSTYLSVPSEFLGGKDGDFYKEAKALKEIDLDQYKHTYLNERVRLGGLIYKKFIRSRFVKTIRDANVNRNTIGADIGMTDGTSFTFTQIRNNFTNVTVRRHYYHKNDVTNKVMGLDYIPGGNDKTVEDYLEDILLFAEECYMLCNQPITIKVDSANKYFWVPLKKMVAQRHIHYLVVKPVNKTKKDNSNDKSAIEERISLTNIMLGAEALEIEDHPSNHELIKALSQAKRGKKGERLDDGTTNIDSLDSFEYSWYEDYRVLINTILKTYNVKRDKYVEIDTTDKSSNVYIIGGKQYEIGG